MTAKNSLIQEQTFSLDDRTEPPPFAQKGISELKKNYSKGVSRYLKGAYIEISTDDEECAKIWNFFSPKKSIFDLWEFRRPFLGKSQTPIFINLKRNGELLATLPLCYESYCKQFKWFGTNWQEENKFFSKDPFYTAVLLHIAPRPINLSGICELDAKRMDDPGIKLEKDDSKYVLDLTKITNREDYLSTLKQKKRYNMRRDVRRIQNLDSKLYFDAPGHFDQMVEIAISRHRSKGDVASWEETPSDRELFRKIMTQDGAYKPRLISSIIDGEVAAVDMICIYNDIYYCLGGGYNVSKYSGIGNYMNIIEIDDAISMGSKMIDFLQIDYGWKKDLFQEVPLYAFSSEV